MAAVASPFGVMAVVWVVATGRLGSRAMVKDGLFRQEGSIGVSPKTFASGLQPWIRCFCCTGGRSERRGDRYVRSM